MLRPEFGHVLFTYKHQWWRLVLLQATVLLGLSAVIGAGALVLQSSGAGLLSYLGADPAQLESRIAAVATTVTLAIALVSLPFVVAGVSATAHVADRAIAGDRPSFWRSLTRGFSRFLPVLGAIALAFALCFAYLVATPVISLVGVLGMVVTAIAAFTRKRKPPTASWWPGWRTWAFAAIPFAWFARVTARALLIVPAAVLEPAGPREAHRTAERAAKGRRLPILVVMAVAFAAAIGISAGFTMLGGALWGEVGASVVGGIAQFFALPAPVVASVALYRNAAGPSGRMLKHTSSPTPERPMLSTSPMMTRIALATVVALVATMGVVNPILNTADSAAANPANAGQNVTVVVTSGEDTVDSAQLEAQQASCAAAGPDCTLRAALANAALDAEDGALSVMIRFAASMTIAVGAPLEFAPNDAAAISAGVLSIDGSGHDIVLDGGSATQILGVASEQWNLSVTHITFSHGYSSAFGGALSAGVPQTELTSVLFDGNTAFMGAGAVFARQLSVHGSTFINSRASSYSGGTHGGAIRTTGDTEVVNSTFSGSAIGDQFTTQLNAGSDIAADGSMTVLNSTFVNSEGGSLRAGAASVMRNSLFTTDSTSGGVWCNGSFTGEANFSPQGDTTCPGTGLRHAGGVVLALDSSGMVPVFPLNPSGNPALGAGVNCPATDALGAVRPATGCDLGAVEFSGLTSLELEAVPSSTVAGSVTLRATMTSDTGAVPQGSVAFSFGGVDRGVIALDDPADATDDFTVAEIVLDNLSMGATYLYSAAFVPSGPFEASAAGPFSYTVEPVQVAVDLVCASGTGPECLGAHWNISDTESIELIATVADDRAGEVVVALDPSGDSPVAGPLMVVDGKATFAIPAGDFGPGLHETLHAVYTSTDGEHIGVSVARSLMVLATPVVTIVGAGSTGIYGDEEAGSVTVTVAGDVGTPSGTVAVFGRQATLDASGSANLDVSTLEVGAPVALTATYGGDGAYGRASSNTIDYETTAAQTTTNIVSTSPAAPQFGEAVTVRVSVKSEAPSAADPQGSVTLVIDDDQSVGPLEFDLYAQDGDGETTFDVVIPAGSIGGGDHTLVAQFTGNDNFTGSDSPSVPGTAISIEAAATSTTLTVAPTAAVWGDQVTLTATVDATASVSTPTGSVAFLAGLRPLGTAVLAPCAAPNPDGCAVASITVDAATLGIGVFPITAALLGTTDFAPSSGVVDDYVVAKATPTVEVTGARTLLYGTSTDYVVTVGTARAKPIDGTQVVITAVNADSDAIPLGTVTLADGSGTMTVPTTGTLFPGTYVITATFAGDASFAAALGTADLAVSEVSTDIDLESISATTVVYGGSLDLSLTVESEFGDLAPEGDVVVTWLGHEVGRVTLGPEHDTGFSGVRVVDIIAQFGTQIPMPDEFWLTAELVPASGFAASRLSSGAQEERKWVTVKPVGTEVTLDMTAVLGLPVEAVATVAVANDDLGITPGGWVTFLVTKSGSGVQEVGPVALVNGQASLADALGHYPEILVDFAGSWLVRATYLKDSDFRYESVSPNDTALKQVDIVAGSAIVTVQPPEPSEYGMPVVVHVSVGGVVNVTGTVQVRAEGLGNILVSDDVQLVNGQADIPLSSLPIGSHALTVLYGGSGGLNPASSDRFTVVVGKTSTTTTVDSTSRVFELYPGIVGATVQYKAHVTASVGAPTGYVNFSRGSTPLGQSPVDEYGNAAVSLTADTEWTGQISATFMSLDGTVASSTGTLAHSWVKAPVTVSLFGPSSARIGVTAEYSAYAQFDWRQFQYLPSSLRPRYGPSGIVTVSAADGTLCAVTLIESTTEQSYISCGIRFPAAGATELTAAYTGDGAYAGGSSSPLTAMVSRGTPVLQLNTPIGASWEGRSTLAVVWAVEGPSDGTVTVKRGDAIVCTSISLDGSCDVPIPAYNDSVHGDRLTLEYSGSATWTGETKTLTGTIIACIPFRESTSNPPGMATVSISPEPTCGGGTGYRSTDTVYVNATAVDGYRITGFSRPLNDSTNWSYAASAVTKYSNGNASMEIQPTLFLSAGEQVPFAVQANVGGQCVPVKFKASGISDRRDAINMLYWETPRNDCSSDVRVGPDNSVTALIPSGAQVKVRYQDGFIPARTKFYGWQALASGDKFAASATYTIGGDTRVITAEFGPVCYDNAPKVVQPPEGTITVSLPEPNCADPQTGKTGWAHGTRGTATLVDAVATTSQVIKVFYGNGKRFFEDRRWLPERPVYFDGWRGDTGNWSEGATATLADGEARRTSRTISFALAERPFTISAAYGGCTALSTQINGDASEGAPGTITVNTAPNCPIGDGNGTSRWYRSGTSVNLSTAATGKSLKFLGWGGFPVGARQKYDANVTFALNTDVTATASYGTNANCRPLAISAVPAGALRLDTRFSLGGNACSAMYGTTFYDQGMDGNVISIDASPATADAEGSQTVFAWTTNELGSPAGSEGGVSTIWSRTSAINEVLYGKSAIIAYACEFVAIGAAVHSPRGQIVSDAGAANISRESQSRLGDFVITQPANCSTGADPKSGYGGYAWTVGTQLVPTVVADSVAYRFTGWSEDVTGTGETPDAPLALVGAGRAAQGDNYNYRVTANFDAICYRLSLPSDADKLEVATAPNCPGMAASDRLYLGGTPVVIHASDRGDTLFRNWVSGVDTVDGDAHWASVIMTSDKSVVPYYSSKSVGEQITQYGTVVGESLAVGTKKMIGVASAAVAAYVKVLVSKVSLVAEGIGYIAQGLEYVGVHGSVIDGMKDASSMMTSMISMLWAPLDCITAWSAGGENTAFFAAQNFLGAAVVSALSAGAQQQQAPPQTAFDKLKARAAAAKEKAEPGVQAVSAIAAAKAAYDAAASGNLGWESSAYDAWASQNSVSVFSTCMSSRAGGAMTSVMSVAP